MAELKTRENNTSVSDFIKKIEDVQKRQDSEKLLKIFEEATKEKPKMWGTSIIGFGKYHYKSSRSKQEGDWFKTGFSPRKGAFSLYIMSGFKEHEKLLKELGKYKLSSGSCLYMNKLADIDVEVLKKLIKESSKKTLANQVK